MKHLVLALTVTSFCFGASAQLSPFLKANPDKKFRTDQDWIKKLTVLPPLPKHVTTARIEKSVRTLPLDNMPCLIAENTGGAQIPNKLSNQSFPPMQNKFNMEIVPIN
jgi:hypothetical protein